MRNTLTIELAPLDGMPHAVNLFLQQVHHGLWDGCSFANNPHHILQVRPEYNEGEELPEGGEGKGAHYGQFYAKGLDKVSYQEYNERYFHAQWTVGLAGRPGGPDFYINKIDNKLIHGPGGQTNKDDMHNEVDPCFGRVVVDGEGMTGKQILDDIDKIPTNKERGFGIKYPVIIINARVLVQNENPVDGWRVITRGQMFDDGIMPLPDVPRGV